MSRISWMVVALSIGCSTPNPVPPTSSSTAALASAGSLASERAQFAWTILPGGKPFLSGGFDGTSSATTFQEVFDPVATVWSRTKDSTESHAGHTATYLPSVSKVLLVGHANELFDPAANKWTADPAPVDRDFHTATLLPGGKVLVVGGADATFKMAPPALYDPGAAPGSRWSAAGTMAKPRMEHFAVLLDTNDKVLVAGGGDGTMGFDESELYDITTNTWSSTAAINAMRSDGAVAALSDGRVLVAGGFNGLPMSGAEIFDPKTKNWSITTDLSVARSGATATRLGSGRVLVVGGAGAGASTTEVFDPKTSTWSKGPALAGPRWDHAAIPLSGGRILIVGGFKSDGARLSTSEVFGGLGGGAACTIDEECLSSSCSSGKCTAADAGTDASAPDTSGTPDTGSPVVDAAPPDASAKPVAAGDFKRCSAGSECSSGFCVDGVCCDSECASACHSCTLPWAPGKCTLEPYGTDRKNACGVSGACVSTCDGKGGCTAAAAGTQCAIAQCTGPATGTGPAVCAAAGAACDQSARVTFDCTPFACEPALSACRSSCIASSDCAPGYVCDTPSRTCVAPPPPVDEGGCTLGRSSSTSGAAWLSLLALAAISRRRR